MDSCLIIWQVPIVVEPCWCSLPQLELGGASQGLVGRQPVAGFQIVGMDQRDVGRTKNLLRQLRFNTVRYEDNREFQIRVYREPLSAVCGSTFKHNAIQIGGGLKRWILVYFSIQKWKKYQSVKIKEIYGNTGLSSSKEL